MTRPERPEELTGQVCEFPPSQVPESVAVIGRLVLVKVRTKHDVRAFSPTTRGRPSVLATDASGRNFYILPEPKWSRYDGGSGPVAEMARKFHGKAPDIQADVRVSREIPVKRKVVGVVEEVVYQTPRGSPKSGTSWYHEAGDKGPGKSDTVTLLTKAQGRWFLDVVKRDGGYPKVTERGLVG